MLISDPCFSVMVSWYEYTAFWRDGQDNNNNKLQLHEVLSGFYYAVIDLQAVVLTENSGYV